jgi:lysophospholipase L1-like esterase
MIYASYQKRNLFTAITIAGLGMMIFPNSGQAQTAKPPTAVMMGDSYASGEGGDIGGGQSYLGAVPIPGSNVVVPPSNQPGNYCHRSAIASIFTAQLPGIEKRFNIACSGATTANIGLSGHESNKNELIQTQYLAEIAKQHDIKLIVVGIGGNDVGLPGTNKFGFTHILKKCTIKFALNALASPGNRGCDAKDMPLQSDIDVMGNAIGMSLDKIIATMNAAGKPPGSYRLILQSYPSPLPEKYHSNWAITEGVLGSRRDTDKTFVSLAVLRGAEGCPFHEKTAKAFVASAQAIGVKMAQIAKSRGVEFLGLHDALVGQARCERSDAGDSAFEAMLHPDGNVWKQWQPGQWAMIQGNTSLFNVVQESMHPNVRGHQLLGKCISGSWADPQAQKSCTANQQIVTYASPLAVENFTINFGNLQTLQGTVASKAIPDRDYPTESWKISCKVDTTYFNNNVSDDHFNQSANFTGTVVKDVLFACPYKTSAHELNIAKRFDFTFTAKVDFTDGNGVRHIGNGARSGYCERNKKVSALKCTY